VVHSVIAALGASPSVRFVHPGNDRSLVRDIADLCRVEISPRVLAAAGGPAGPGVVLASDQRASGWSGRPTRAELYGPARSANLAP